MGAGSMWRFWFCVVALVAAPALAQTPRDSDDRSFSRHRSEFGAHRDGYHRPRPGAGALSSLSIEPYRQGPAPAGFWYRCDAPPGNYPYIPSCRMPWRIVPSGPHR
jgi:hypothetical protein